MPFRNVLAVAGQLDANNVTTPPTIDGNLNEAGWSLATTASESVSGTPNNTVTFGAMWDNTNLYVGIKVLDANLFNDSANTWEDDSAEVYIDANHNHGTTYDSFDRQYVKGYNDTGLAGTGSQTGVQHAWAAVTGGYSVEFAIPWSNLGVTPTAGLMMGFDIGNNDDDNAGTRDSQLIWWGDLFNYNNTANFGHVNLLPAGGATATRTNTPNGPTNTPTSTATRTNTPIGPTPTPTNTLPAGGTVKVNFQIGTDPAYLDYLIDGGAVYANRGNGQTYGWNVDNATWARNRNSAASPDERYDTLSHMQKGAGSSWEIAVANGTYSVHIVSGDPTAIDSVFNVTAEGVTVVSGTPSASVHWFEGTQNITVSDGKLTITNGTGSSNNKINYIDITSGGGPTNTPTNTSVAPTNTPTRTPTPTNTLPCGCPTNTPTRTPTPGSSTNLALGKPITANGSTGTFVATNGNDNSVTTYWEGAGYPSILTIDLGANADITSIVVKLNPDGAWATRTQTLQVLSHNQSTSTFSNLVSSAAYVFNPATANTVTIPVSATASAVQVSITANTGAPSGQIAEFQIMGTMAPNPDLTITNVTWSPSSPSEVDAITLNATVQNIGSAASPASTVNFNLGGALVGTANVGALNAGASSVVPLNIGTRSMGTYSVAATVDPTNTIIEQNNANNTFTAPSNLVVTQAPGPDLQIISITANPQSPAVGAAVTFTVAVNNRGTTAVAAGTTTRLVVASTTLNNTNSPAIGVGATVNVAISGSWTAVNGASVMTATADATGIITETSETNNSLANTIIVGRGAAIPWTELEAESATYTGTLVTANALRTFGHTNFATESSGRQSVRLDSTGQYVEFTSTASSNSIVVRNAIPDAGGGGGISATISLYINGTFLQKITLSSQHSWLYGNTDQPEGLTNTPGPDARRMFDESHALLANSYPAGTKFKLQRDSGDSASYYYIDFIDLEQVAPPLSMPAGCTSITAYGAVANDGIDDTAAIQAALMADSAGTISCVWIPAGQWRQEQKFLTPDPARGQWNQKGLRDVTVRGAGMWHSQLYTLTEPQNVVGGINHPHEGNSGFDIDNNVQISDIAIFGAGRIRGGDGNAEGGVGLNGRFGQNTVITNVWIEHTNVGVWCGRDYSDTPAYWNPAINLQFSGMRIRDTYADGINLTNGSRLSTVFNSSFRYTGDDSLAVWANQAVQNQTVDITHDNHFTNNTIQLPWRANGIAIYGGYGNTIENNLIFDTMNYPGIMLATDHSPLPFSGTTLIKNNGLYRAGGVFWNEAQEFGAITLFPSTSAIVGVTIRDTYIYDSTYDGIQFKNGGGQMPNVQIINVTIDKSNNGAGILAMGGANGNATLTNVVITNSADGNIVIQPGSQFIIN